MSQKRFEIVQLGKPTAFLNFSSQMYDIESLEELRRSIGCEDLSSSDRSEGLETIDEWESNIQMREALQLAIRLQSSVRKLELTS